MKGAFGPFAIRNLSPVLFSLPYGFHNGRSCMLIFRKRENLPTFPKECQDATALTYGTLDGKVAHVIRWGGETLTGFREIDSDPRYDQAVHSSLAHQPHIRFFKHFLKHAVQPFFLSFGAVAV